MVLHAKIGSSSKGFQSLVVELIYKQIVILHYNNNEYTKYYGNIEKPGMSFTWGKLAY